MVSVQKSALKDAREMKYEEAEIFDLLELAISNSIL
jgi:hypothetical protein